MLYITRVEKVSKHPIATRKKKIPLGRTDLPPGGTFTASARLRKCVHDIDIWHAQGHLALLIILIEVSESNEDFRQVHHHHVEVWKYLRLRLYRNQSRKAVKFWRDDC